MTGAQRVVRGPAMTDVARLAGVSHQTVSRVLNGHPSVREETRGRVRAAIAELGYRPNHAARALATGRSRTLGVVSLHSTLFGPASMLAALAQAAADDGFAVSVDSVTALDGPSITRSVERLLDHGVAGVVLIAPVDSATEALDDLDLEVPLVTLDGDPARPGGRAAIGLATVDQVVGGRLATEHLLEAEHATVWHVAGPEHWFDSEGRVAGWRAALAAAGAEEPPLLRARDWSAAAGYEAGQLVSRMPEVTAVFAANDHVALGLFRALAERGRSVPGDVSVVGFDDVPEAAYLFPPLTTVRPDFDAVAQAGLAVLLDALASGGPATGTRTIPPQLVARASVAPPAR